MRGRSAGEAEERPVIRRSPWRNKEGRPLGRPSQTFRQKVRSEENYFFFFFLVHFCDVVAVRVVPFWYVFVSVVVHVPVEHLADR